MLEVVGAKSKVVDGRLQVQIDLQTKGDLPGHPFRGNQWTGGQGGLSDGVLKTPPSFGTGPATIDHVAYEKRIAEGGLAIDRVCSRTVEEEMIGDSPAINRSMYGTGIYFAEAGAQRMATSGGNTIRAVLSGDAKVVTSSEIRKIMDETESRIDREQAEAIKKHADRLTNGDEDLLRSELSEGKYRDVAAELDERDAILNGILRDPGAVARVLGYDAMEVKSKKYVLVLDRSKLIVDSD